MSGNAGECAVLPLYENDSPKLSALLNELSHARADGEARTPFAAGPLPRAFGQQIEYLPTTATQARHPQRRGMDPNRKRQIAQRLSEDAFHLKLPGGIAGWGNAGLGRGHGGGKSTIPDPFFAQAYDLSSMQSPHARVERACLSQAAEVPVSAMRPSSHAEGEAKTMSATSGRWRERLSATGCEEK